ncbi:MAG: cytochrome d ubiquinol oxidase subunit II [Bacteriovoracaceae bacterium]|nr:cytochrome d ubiquinol oxidase subunit II [Bacteriovoracaceae bacterium]
MIEFIVLITGVAVFLYTLLAGADFGAGILQILPIGIDRKEKTSLIGMAMGPVWEANHIWLILALVISFNAFPQIFWFVSEWYHFPLGALAIGIIFRGASFTFLHYDPIKDGSQKVYHWFFGLSSIWCTFWIGLIVGSMMLGDFSLTDTGIFERYFKHWINPFSFSMGIFATVLMMFNASLFLTAEAKTQRMAWKKLTIKIFALLVFSGLLTHGVLLINAPERWKLFFLNPISITLIALSFLLLFAQLYTIEKNIKNLSRLVAGIQLICILGAGFVPLYPNFVLTKDGVAISFIEASAEPRVLELLCYALVFGLLFILPAYYFLMKIFKIKSED